MREIVKEINKVLQDGEPNNITRKEYGSFKGTGYKPQAIFDAVNSQIMFSHRVLEGYPRVESVDDSELIQVVAAVLVDFFDPEDLSKPVFSTGVQFGTMNVVYGDVGNAYKGAVTDAIEKCMSLVGIASRAYMGTLAAEFEQDEEAEKPKSKVKFGGNKKKAKKEEVEEEEEVEEKPKKRKFGGKKKKEEPEEEVEEEEESEEESEEEEYPAWVKDEPKKKTTSKAKFASNKGKFNKFKKG